MIGWRRALCYGVALATGVVLLQWLQFQRIARTRADDLALGLIAAGFLAVGVFAGARLFGRQAPRPPGNPAAIAALRISGRELEVLRALAAGQANKEIARSLGVSPNTVKSHVARLYQKLEAQRRTDAVARARALGILP